ncbi:MAG TPA: hypothetical protein VFB13_17825 [Reyranella sp.]|nr:hypothetical protein [Reyranella sp.]
MSQIDLVDNVLAKHSIDPQALGSSATVTGASVDLFGYDSAMALFSAGAWTDGTHTITLEDSSDNSSFSTVGAGSLQGSITNITGTGQQNAVQQVGYIGSKRYLRAKVVSSGVTTGLAGFAALIVKGNPKVYPAS